MMQRNRGVALVWTALFLLIMIGMVGLSIDWGKATWNVHQMQNAGDAAALAGAQVVKFDWQDPLAPEGARQRALRYAALNIADGRQVTLDRNDSNVETGELVIGRWIRQEDRFVPTMEAPNAVKASVRRLGQREDAPKAKLLFGPIFGTDDVSPIRDSIAISLGSSGAGIICLADYPEDYAKLASGPGYGSGGGVWTNEKQSGLIRDGGCEIDLRGPNGWIGDMQVNSTSTSTPNDAFLLNGASGKIWASEINVVGSARPAYGWEAYYGDPPVPFSVNISAPPLPDPLYALNFTADTPPSISGMPTLTCPSVAGGLTKEIQPGWYPNGINPEGGTIKMAAGIYAVGGGTKKSQVTGLVFNGGTLIGTGVTVFVTGDVDGTKTGTAGLWGKVNIGAIANVQLVSPGDAAGAGQVSGREGVVIWQDINNHTEATVIGSASSSFMGTMYFPDAPVQLGGGTSEVGCQIIAGALHLHGNVSLNVAYDGRNFIKAYRSVLVK